MHAMLLNLGSDSSGKPLEGSSRLKNTPFQALGTFFCVFFVFAYPLNTLSKIARPNFLPVVIPT